MDAKSLREYIDRNSYTTTVVMGYDGLVICIDLLADKTHPAHYSLGYGDICKDYNTLDELMSDRIYNGNSLNEIAHEVDVD